MVNSFTRNNKAQLHLIERVKELTCLYDIARIAADTSMVIEKLLYSVVEILPRAWQYPHAACAKIVLDKKPYTTDNFRQSGRRQRSAIVIKGKQRGYVEVAYPNKQMIKDQKPFLDEEQQLLDTVACEVAAMVRRRETEQDKLKIEDQLRHADRLATIGQLAASIAHELNEPLAHIMGFAELVQKSPELSVQVRADVDKIFNTSLHAREIVKQLLIFSRQASPQKTKTNINDIVKQGLSLLESRCVSEGIDLTYVLCSTLPEIDADALQIRQVFVSLMVNAMQAMPQGGKITIRTQKKRAKVSLAVEDTGCGMEDEILQKIFNPFFTTKEVGIGTGLGLPVVHSIIKAHGGAINFKSKVGIGTKCIIELPARRSQTC